MQSLVDPQARQLTTDEAMYSTQIRINFFLGTEDRPSVLRTNTQSLSYTSKRRGSISAQPFLLPKAMKLQQYQGKNSIVAHDSLDSISLFFTFLISFLPIFPVFRFPSIASHFLTFFFDTLYLFLFFFSLFLSLLHYFPTLDLFSFLLCLSSRLFYFLSISQLCFSSSFFFF